LTLKPKCDNVCDECGGELYEREDDKPEVVQDRLNVYRKKTEPLMEYFNRKRLLKNVHCNDLMTPPETIVEEIMLMISRVQEP
jgi:adenylate kinase family enzyme